MAGEETRPRTPYQQPPGQQIPPWWTDPTENVKDLVSSEMRRQDDLRQMTAKFTTQISKIRYENMRYVSELNGDHSRELRQIESARLDAIRLVDVGAVQRAAEVQATQAGALAAQVTATADAFRVSLSAALEPIQKDIRDLRDAQSRGVGGKEQVVETRDVQTGQRADHGGSVATIQAIIMGLAILISMISVIAFVLKK